MTSPFPESTPAGAKTWPLISVVVPSYNYERYVEEAIKSIWAQNYPRLEIVVVDDASTDGSLALLKRLASVSPVPMHIIANAANLGPNRTLNRAIRAATGEYLAILAADDLFLPSRFKDQVEILQENSHIAIVYANGRAFLDGNPPDWQVHQEPYASILRLDPRHVLRYLYTHVNPFFVQTILVRRDFLLACGAFDEAVLADDWILNIRVFQHLVIRGWCHAFIDRDVMLYRFHETNLHKQRARHRKLHLQVVARYTPWYLKWPAYSRIFDSVAEISAADGRPLLAAGFGLLSALMMPRPSSLRHALKRIDRDVFVKLLGKIPGTAALRRRLLRN